jgi:hypothetical protein
LILRCGIIRFVEVPDKVQELTTDVSRRFIFVPVSHHFVNLGRPSGNILRFLYLIQKNISDVVNDKTCLVKSGLSKQL